MRDLVRPVREAQPAERVVGCAGRDRVRRAAATPRPPDSAAPRLLEPDVEARRVEPHVGAHDARQQDVADPVVDRVGPVDPVLLHQHGLEAEVRGHRGHLAGVVGLQPPIETSVSAPCASASGTRYSSLRVLLPPNARPLFTSSRLAQICGAAEVPLSRGSGWMGLGPNVRG